MVMQRLVTASFESPADCFLLDRCITRWARVPVRDLTDARGASPEFANGLWLYVTEQAARAIANSYNAARLMTSASLMRGNKHHRACARRRPEHRDDVEEACRVGEIRDEEEHQCEEAGDENIAAGSREGLPARPNSPVVGGG